MGKAKYWKFRAVGKGKLMTITDVEAIHLRLPQVEQIADGTQDVLVIRLHTDAGLVGIGEVSSQSYVCKAIFEAPPSAERRHGLAYILRGQDPMDIEGLWQRMYYHTSRYGRRGAAIHAISGADLALWDLRGKILGKPVSELLGGTASQVRARLRELSIWIDARGDCRSGAPSGRSGTRGGEVRLGPVWQGRFHRCDAHVEAARRAVGDQCELMVDAGQKFDVTSALERAIRLAPFNIAWLEEPLSPDDLSGYADLCARSPVPIAGGELEVTRWGFEELIARGLHVIQPDVAICGGLTVARQASELAERSGRRCVPHCFSTGINLAASLHWMASYRPGDLVEYCLSRSPLMRQLVRNLPAISDSRVAVPDGPGLGIELDEDVVARFRVS